MLRMLRAALLPTGTSDDNPHLSVASGTDAGDGCRLIVNSGVGADVDQNAFVDFPASDGMPLAFDAGRAIAGVIDLQGLSVGLAEVDAGLEALVNGQRVAVGSDTASALLDPAPDDNPVAFAIQPDASLAGADLQDLDLRVRGWGQPGAFDHTTPGMPANDPDGAAALMTRFVAGDGRHELGRRLDPVLRDRLPVTC
jgi:hypothetical protein